MKVGFIGSGAWATALANVVTDNGHEAIVYGISKEEIDDINKHHRNSKYFSKVSLNKNIKGTMFIEDAVEDSDIIVIAVPSSQIRNVLAKIKNYIINNPIILNVSKGFDSSTHKRLSEVIKENLDDSLIKGVVTLIWPSYAEEVVVRFYTAISAVSSSMECASIIQNVFSNKYFRVYTNDDEIGAEVGAVGGELNVGTGGFSAKGAYGWGLSLDISW